MEFHKCIIRKMGATHLSHNMFLVMFKEPHMLYVAGGRMDIGAG